MCLLAFSECKPVHTLVACAFSKHCLLKFPQSGSAGSYNNSISISVSLQLLCKLFNLDQLNCLNARIGSTMRLEAQTVLKINSSNNEPL